MASASANRDLRITDISATQLKNVEAWGSNSPFISFKLHTSSYRTSVAKKAGTDPIWEDVVSIENYPLTASELRVQMMNSNKMRPSDHIGYCPFCSFRCVAC